MESKYGVENIKNALKFGINLTKAIEDALSDDDKITGLEWFNIARTIPGIISVVKHIKEIEDEYLDLDDDETAELKVWFATEFDIPNDVVEVKIEKAFSLVLTIADGIFDIFDDDTV